MVVEKGGSMTRHYLRLMGALWYSKEYYGFTDENLKPILKRFGVKNIRKAHANGWKNQEKVLTFDLDPSRVDELEKAIPHCNRTGLPYFVVREKDWK